MQQVRGQQEGPSEDQVPFRGEIAPADGPGPARHATFQGSQPGHQRDAHYTMWTYGRYRCVPCQRTATVVRAMAAEVACPHCGQRAVRIAGGLDEDAERA